MNIILLGYRGTGKSTVAKYLARALSRTVYRIDDLIVEAAGKPIPRIVEEGGWPKFRELEAGVVREVSSRARDAIIDCGGGVVVNDDNIRHLKRDGRAVLLTASLEALMERIRRDPNRPPLKKGLSFEEEQRQIIAEREPKYRAAADLVVDTTKKQPAETASEIIQYFTEKLWIVDEPAV